MKLNAIYFILMSFFTISIYGQSGVQCELSTLSKLTLDKSPSIKSGALNIDNAKANLQVQSSAFDYQLNSEVSLSNNKVYLFNADSRNEIIDDQIKTNNTDISIALQRKLRSGLSASLGVNYSQLSDNFPINRFNENVGPDISNHTVSTTLSLTQPLLKGRGKRITTALEKGSALNIESAQNNFEITGAYELLQMGIAYWQYLTSYKSLEIYRLNEKRVRNVLQITQELVKADKKPAGDVVQIRADLADKERQTKVAEQNLYNSKLNLGRVVGLSESESQEIGIPLNEFPEVSKSGFNEGLDITLMNQLAKKNRSDLKGFEKSNEAVELQLSLAKNNLKAQLDLTGFMNYGGMNMGNGIQNAFSGFGNREGRNYTIGLALNFTFPLNNNFAKGSFLQSKTTLNVQLISYNNLQRNIDLNINISLNNLKNSVLILNKAKESLGFYQSVFNNEQVKFQNGLTTLLNLILFQERLTFAELEYTIAQQQFAVAIINIRYETGTLILMEENKVKAPSNQVYYEIPKLNN